MNTQEALRHLSEAVEIANNAGFGGDFDEAIAHLRSRIQAPRVSVTRELVVSILAEAGGDTGIETERVERACAQLREVGVVVTEY